MTTEAPPPVAMPHTVRIQKDERDLAVPLDTFTRLELGQRLVALHDRQRDVDSDLASAKLQHKTDTATIEAHHDDVIRTLRAGSIIKSVPVEIHTDLLLGTVSYYRMDTGELYHSRPVSAEERQAELALVPPPATQV